MMKLQQHRIRRTEKEFSHCKNLCDELKYNLEMWGFENWKMEIQFVEKFRLAIRFGFNEEKKIAECIQAPAECIRSIPSPLERGAETGEVWKRI